MSSAISRRRTLGLIAATAALPLTELAGERSAPQYSWQGILLGGQARMTLTGLNEDAAREAIGAIIYGQSQVVENTLVTILAGGHALLVGVPGLAKTKLVETLGTVLGLGAGRIQFTPDLMPSDIIGSEILDQDNAGKRSFRFVKGPIFAQLLMVARHTPCLSATSCCVYPSFNIFPPR